MFYGFVALHRSASSTATGSSCGASVYLLYGCGGLFLMGLAVRAMIIGPSR